MDAEERARELIRELNDSYDSEVFVSEGYAYFDELVFVVAAALRAERDRAIEDCAKVVESKADLYPIEVFSEPTTSSPPDAYAARMARHCSKVWAEDIRALKDKP